MPEEEQAVGRDSDEWHWVNVFDCIQQGKIAEAEEVGKKAIEDGIDAAFVGEAAIAAFNYIGNAYLSRRIALPQLIMASRSFDSIIKPYAKQIDDSEARGVVVIGVVENDIHTIGESLAAGMLKVYGYKVYDLGKDVPAEKFIEKAKEVNADIIGITTLMTSTMPEVPKIVEAAKKAGIRDDVKIMTGGAPVQEKFARDSGCDGYGQDAVLAVKVANSLMEGEKAYLSQ